MGKFRIEHPVVPGRGFRGTDAWGDGSFGAARSRNGKSYLHDGLDCITKPGDSIVAPFKAQILKAGIAYPNSVLGSLHLLGVDEFKGLKAIMLYVAKRPECVIGGIVESLTPIATAQDVAAYHQPSYPNRAAMTNHLHLKTLVMKDGVWQIANPMDFLVAAS